jgi:hypothetical protein
LRCAVLLLGIGLTFSLRASDVEQAEIKFVGSAYWHKFTIAVEGSLEAVREIVTDYDHLDRINGDIIKSEIIERFNETKLKRRLWLNHCVLVFCFDLYFVEHVEILNDGSIRTTVLPNESNFRRGVATWRLDSITDTSTRISVEAEQEPDFWIPPVIGPLLFKRTFMKEVRKTADNIEREARRAHAK